MPHLTPPASVVDIARTLERAGFEAWCVGGAVRDAFLGIETLDWDLATSARPEVVQRLFRRTVPVGIRFGTVGVLDHAGVLHEVTTFRRDVETDGRHAVVTFGASLDEDLARRDFTINAIAVHPDRLEVRDPFRGRADLEARVLRCVGAPAERMREDRLRALRALRFAGRFDFSIESATWMAIVESAPHLGRLSMERVKQELDKVMAQVARPARTLERYREAGIFAALVPALADVPPARFAAIDHLPHRPLAGRPGRIVLRLAALFAEPGVAPPRDLERTLKALRFSNVESRLTIDVARALAAPEMLATFEGDAVALRRWVADAGRLVVPSALRVACARALADGAIAGGAEAHAWQRACVGRFRRLHRRAMAIAWRDPITLGDLAVDGEDLRTIGITDGRAIGETLRRLRDAVLEDPALNTVEQLLACARRLP
ncbi:MAG: tRNA cytidylyltransferase [Gemmatimonadetes bacterium]|nr:tRNA cytidylyltransferase [Gemmatimonadota bacterium]